MHGSVTQFHSIAAPKANQAPLKPIATRKPQRISVSINWALYQRLLDRSDAEGRSLSNLAAHLLEVACCE